MMLQRYVRLLLLLLIPCAAIRVPPSAHAGQRRDEAPRETKRTVDVPIPDSPDGHLVTSLPLLDPASFPTKQWAGHLPASGNKDKYFFYWLFAPRDTTLTKDADIPLVIWLNGGPACSSMDGLFIENGPFRFIMDETTKEYRLIPDEYSWHRLPAYTLYIDQPVGTGLSFTTSGKYPTNDDELNTDFYYFLQSFLRFHGDKFVSIDDPKQMNRPLFFSGESYAGHYNVIFTNHILKQNNKALKDNGENIYIPVKGAAIGNGWVDPYYQYAGAEAAYGHGLIGTAELAAFNEKEIVCQQKLLQGKYSSGICFDLVDDIVSNSHGKNSNVHACSYDIRRTESKNGDRAFPPGHKIIETYLGNVPLRGHPGTLPADIAKEVLVAVHAQAAEAAGQQYLECTDPPYFALSGSDGKGAVPDLVQVLEHPDGVELLFFNGIFDMVCNHVGNERSLEKLPWTNNEQWNAAPRYAWSAPSEPAGKVSGYMREFNNLKYLKINDAGHMVRLDDTYVQSGHANDSTGSHIVLLYLLLPTGSLGRTQCCFPHDAKFCTGKKLSKQSTRPDTKQVLAVRCVSHLSEL
jgi:carboxypeptidase D